MTDSAAAVTQVTEALAARIAAVEQAGAVVGLAAAHLVTGRQLLHRPDELFPLASAVKLPVLVTLYEEVAAGRADLRERVTYRAASRVPGSGVLQDLDDGLTLTLRDLATLMITISDNTAAELLTDRLGKPRIEGAMQAYGLSSIRVPLGVRALLYELVDLDWTRPGQYEEARELLRAGAGSGGRALMPEQSDRGSPRDLCRLMELIRKDAILDAPSCDDILEILRRTKSDSRIPALLPKGTIIGHKTGTIRSVRNDVGVVEAPNGPYAVAILTRAVPSDIHTDVAIAEVSLAVYEELTG
jgi:beta-lactamase class A